MLSALWTPRDLKPVLASAGVELIGDSADAAVLTLCPSCRRLRQATGFLSGMEGKVAVETEDRQKLGEEA
jgi:hypothetical protein